MFLCQRIATKTQFELTTGVCELLEEHLPIRIGPNTSLKSEIRFVLAIGSIRQSEANTVARVAVGFRVSG